LGPFTWANRKRYTHIRALKSDEKMTTKEVVLFWWYNFNEKKSSHDLLSNVVKMPDLLFSTWQLFFFLFFVDLIKFISWFVKLFFMIFVLKFWFSCNTKVKKITFFFEKSRSKRISSSKILWPNDFCPFSLRHNEAPFFEVDREQFFLQNETTKLDHF